MERGARSKLKDTKVDDRRSQVDKLHESGKLVVPTGPVTIAFNVIEDIENQTYIKKETLVELVVATSMGLQDKTTRRSMNLTGW